MLFRRLAAAFALLVAGLVSQLPEYTQQYRQRLGGALDEIEAALARFDSEAGREALSRDQGIARLKGNNDALAQARGSDLDGDVARADRLRQQRDAFQTAGPLSQYAVLAESLDPDIARRALVDYQPALPVTVGGIVAAVLGFAGAWLGIHVVAMPFRRRRIEYRSTEGPGQAQRTV